MKKQVFNPFLPSAEYIPDGEPHLFDGRVYLFGSHDRFGGEDFCLNNYVCWSAPENDLSDWQFHGYIYDVTTDPLNNDGKWAGYAPDVCRGADGRYYLYYALNCNSAVSVAVSDEPFGKYEFYGHVKTKDGRAYGSEEGDVIPFDPGVFVDTDGRIHLYVGFSHTAEMVSDDDPPTKQKTNGAYHFELDEDMLTIKSEPVFVCPGMRYSKGTSFEEHGFFEAPSMRRFGEKYYFIYSSQSYHELCYAAGDAPDGPFTYGGVLVSAVDVGIDGNREPLAYPANNHGSIEKIGDDYYIFYHRHTNRTMYSRQACAERIRMREDGTFMQAETTSCGLNVGPLSGKGFFEARIACNLSSVGGTSDYGWGKIDDAPCITQNVPDCEDPFDENAIQYISNMGDGSFAAFRYFEFFGGERIKITVKGDFEGFFEISLEKTELPSLKVHVSPTKNYAEFTSEDVFPKGVYSLRFTLRGKGHADLLSFELY
ncbi:MAG: alpha-N-arabinofuranosidase [Ruminococcaceae bacterium]|nr:alpha-N-arabinofuranosidase [Oscillospiraceae bacterium]